MGSTTVNESTYGSISSVHPDIFQTHILTRLDGPTLASAAVASSYLQRLYADQNLWRKLSVATWPSVDNPRVFHLISSFPDGFRSFFADSYPFIDHFSPSTGMVTDPPERLISAVDLYYGEELICSKVQEIKIGTGVGSESEYGWFMSSPFRVDILDPKETIPTRILYPGGDYESWVNDIEQNMTLNWILIDSTRKRAANISSRRSVSAKRSWITGDIEIRFSTAVAECAEVAVVVACGAAEVWKEVDEEIGGEVHVKGVRLRVEDIEGKCMNGRDSLVILQGLVQGKRVGGGGDKGSVMKERYDKYVETKREWREKTERREKARDLQCMIFGIALFLAFWCLILFR